MVQAELTLSFGVARRFETFIKERLAEKAWTKSEVARRWQPHKDVASSVSYFSKVMRGKIRPPADDLERLADALWLEGEQRARFIEYGLLAQGPEALELMIVGLQRQLEELRLRIRGDG